jgi:hypothetical protein
MCCSGSPVSASDSGPISVYPEMGERSFFLATPRAEVLPKRPMWSAGVGLRNRTTAAVRAAMDGSPSEVEARSQPEVDFKVSEKLAFPDGH